MKYKPIAIIGFTAIVGLGIGAASPADAGLNISPKEPCLFCSSCTGSGHEVMNVPWETGVENGTPTHTCMGGPSCLIHVYCGGYEEEDALGPEDIVQVATRLSVATGEDLRQIIADTPRAFLNAQRGAVQIGGCLEGHAVAHVPLSDRQIASLE